ncbi:hypothetical protein EDB19DRAFT_1738432 [Suillus lakei]|nr:hypothetical protein EDB19DRAFT_1738432 [Suillus lakei]
MILLSAICVRLLGFIASQQTEKQNKNSHIPRNPLRIHPNRTIHSSPIRSLIPAYTNAGGSEAAGVDIDSEANEVGA